MNYLLSVIIPTKNRYIYLKECIRTIVSLDSSEIEIVIQDNTQKNEEILHFLQKLNFPNIKYFHETNNLSQTENSDLALSNATGKYVCYIGDDDTITKQMLDVVIWADQRKIESCIFPVAIYYWPDVVFKFFKYPTLSFPLNRLSVNNINAKEQLNKCLRKGGTTLNKLPKVYHGIVLKDKLEEVYEKTNSYFPGPSPDMANATSLALVIKKHVWIEFPLMVSGYSYKSAGGMGARGSHKARIKDVAQLPLNTEEKWEHTIPKIWLASTIWSESCIKALRAMKYESLIKDMNWSYLYANMLTHNVEYIEEVKPYLNSPLKIIKTLFWFTILFTQKSFNFIRNFFRTKFNLTKKRTYHGVSSLEEAMVIVNDYNQKNNFVDKLTKMY
ncbi:glycosyltransferase family 2 protein [Bacillus suaedaesalsae]|uniref:Glycosyltransferase family 2 protein n=1 Tax=Bacillus suaedaesalsae TaxID=2810349 RepID=A0ABS2DM06_9BACI|nr:glycosyltransferase family 2 protein [Bacillus suaedaesalsae]MBM6619095.1 glycosyltransferase family 2 protein [Bacillus suaedaesalsae]